MEEKFRTTGKTANAGESSAQVAAVEAALNHLLDNRPEEAILLLETSLVLCQEVAEVMEEHLVKDGALGTWGAINPYHSREEYPENGPENGGSSNPSVSSKSPEIERNGGPRVAILLA